MNRLHLAEQQPGVVEALTDEARRRQTAVGLDGSHKLVVSYLFAHRPGGNSTSLPWGGFHTGVRMSRRLIALVGWPLRSQRVARRNAQQAAIALAHERRQRERVEEEVAGLVDRCRESRRRPSKQPR